MITSKEFYKMQGMVDRYDRIRPYSILDLFQEIAGVHANDLGFGYEYMMQNGINWILVRNKFEIIKYPTVSSVVKVETWPIKPKRFESERQYIIYDESGNILVKGSSIWVVIDVINKRIVSDDKIIYPGEFVDKNNFEEKFSKIRITNKDDFKFVKSFEVLPSMIDHNNHMNNAKYSELFFDTYNMNESDEIDVFQVDHVKESLVGDIIDVYQYKLDNELYLFGKVNDNVVMNIYVRFKLK